MEAINHNIQPKEEWRTGVFTRMRISELTGSTELCVFEQWCAPGTGAPTHTHKVEEVLSVISGKAEVHLGSKIAVLSESSQLSFRRVWNMDFAMSVIVPFTCRPY